jgi:hypothetical protein
MLRTDKLGRSARSTNDPKIAGKGASSMTVTWQRENAEGSLWSATVTDGQQGWFEIQMERSADGWDWAINHDRRFWGQESTVEKAKIAAAAQLEQTGQHFPRCEICRFTENESGGYLMSFPDFPAL